MSLNYRTILQDELERRKTLNPSYSLRAFALHLGMTAPQLSTVLNETKGLSAQAARRIAAKLELSPNESEIFKQSVEALHARTTKKRKTSEAALKKLLQSQNFKTIKQAQFSLMNEWYYLSLLQTFELRDFEPSIQWIASRLGISTTEVEKGLITLEDVGLLKRTKSFFKLSQEFVKTENIPSRTIRFYLQSMMTKASRALETQSIDERDYSSTVFSVDTSRLGEFKKQLASFREEFCQEASKSLEKNEIYNLSIQFFKITKK